MRSQSASTFRSPSYMKCLKKTKCFSRTGSHLAAWLPCRVSLPLLLHQTDRSPADVSDRKSSADGCEQKRNMWLCL